MSTPVLDEEQLRIMEAAVREIDQLRESNKLMGARLRMFDEVMLLIRMQGPQMGTACQPDIAGEIRYHLEQQEKLRTAPTTRKEEKLGFRS
jgi:hypothetical protein